MNATEARYNYLRWLSRAAPDMYALAMAKGENGIGDYEEGLSGWVDTIVNAAVAIGGTVLAKKQSDAQLKMQKAQLAADAAASDKARADSLALALLQTNTQRAAAGLAPVNINGQVIPTSQLPAPTPQLAAQLSPGSFSSGFDGYMPYLLGGAALLAVVLFSRSR